MSNQQPNNTDLPTDPQQRRIAELLRSMPGPGPMPASVSDRILAALEHERAAQASDADRASEPDRPVPAVHSLAEARAARRANRWARPLAGLAAAAAVGAIAVVGYQQQHHDRGTVSAVPAQSSIAVSDVADGVHVEKSGTSYTTAGFSQQASALSRSGDAHPVSAADIQSLGSVATKQGALNCAQSIGVSLLGKPDRVTVDIADFDRAPALVVVVTKDGKSTAWALSRSCDKQSKPLAGPTSVSS